MIYQEYKHEELTLESALSKQKLGRPENIFVCLVSDNFTKQKCHQSLITRLTRLALRQSFTPIVFLNSTGIKLDFKKLFFQLRFLSCIQQLQELTGIGQSVTLFCHNLNLRIDLRIDPANQK